MTFKAKIEAANTVAKVVSQHIQGVINADSLQFKIANNGLVASLLSSGLKAAVEIGLFISGFFQRPTDTVTATDSGTVVVQNFVAGDYFAEGYVGEEVSF